MRSRVLPIGLGCLGLLLVTPLLIAMGVVVSREDHASAPTGPSVVEGTVASPNVARGPIGEPFVYGLVKIYATYNRAGRQMYGSMSYVDEHRGSSRVTLSTSTGPVEVTLPDPFTHWRNAHPDQQSYETPQQVPGWNPAWQSPPRVRSYIAYVLAVRSGETLLVDRDPSGVGKDVWIGGRAASDASTARNEGAKQAFSLGSFAAGGICGLVSLVLVAVGFLRKKS